MDKKGSEGGKGGNWAWVPDRMPGVVRLMAEKRKTLGNAHVNECWRRAMVDLEPGWLFASERGVSLGPLPTDAEIAAFVAQRCTATQSVLFLRLPEVAHGAN